MSVTLQIINSSNEILFQMGLLSVDTLKDVYRSGFRITYAILFLGICLHALYRCYKLFSNYAAGMDVDFFDKSVFFEVGVTNGTHPLGIIVDAVFIILIAMLLASIWPISILVTILALIAEYKRKQNIEAKKIMDRLAGNSNYES